MSIIHSLILAREFLQLRRNFDRYFEVMPASTPELIEHCFRVRYRVYCEELRWEPLNKEKLEYDEFDDQSLHLLLRSKQLNEFVGCIRVIRTNQKDPYQRLPFEQACAHTLDYRLLENLAIPRKEIGEISRLAVDSRFRRRPGEYVRPVGMSDEDYGSIVKPRFPYIPVGLYLAMLESAQRHGIDALFMLTEPWLARHFNRLGVRIEPVGGAVTHHGERIPSMMSVSVTVRSLHVLVKPLYKGISEHVRDAYNSQENLPLAV